MKYFLFIILFTFSVSAFAQQNVLIIKGTYHGENLIIDNPFTSTGLGYCISEIRVNGKMSTDEINSSSFEIDLSVYQLKKGDEITIAIKHKEGCTPKAVNPNVLEPRSTFDTQSIKVDMNGVLSWVTTNEVGKLDYIVEQYKWNKWVKVGKVEGLGEMSKNKYSVKVNLHSGINRFRVKQIDYTRRPRYSPEAKLTNLRMQPVQFTKKRNKIIFTQSTEYELYDEYGQKKKIGSGKEIDISNLDNGTYYLNYDNTMQEFKK